MYSFFLAYLITVTLTVIVYQKETYQKETMLNLRLSHLLKTSIENLTAIQAEVEKLEAERNAKSDVRQLPVGTGVDPKLVEARKAKLAAQAAQAAQAKTALSEEDMEQEDDGEVEEIVVPRKPAKKVTKKAGKK